MGFFRCQVREPNDIVAREGDLMSFALTRFFFRSPHKLSHFLRCALVGSINHARCCFSHERRQIGKSEGEPEQERELFAPKLVRATFVFL